jgi:N-acetylmuramoyl-L-alanine amidase
VPRPIDKAWRFLVGLILLGVAGAGSAEAAPEARLIDGASRYELVALGRGLGLEARWVRPGRSLRLSSRWSRLEFEREERACTFNGVRVFLGEPVVAARDSLWISALDFEHTLQPLLRPQAHAAAAPGPLRRILLDPGHGGKDAGAVNEALGLKEKSLTLDLAVRVERLLRAAGYEVAYTRTEDRFVGLAERGAMAARTEADLFLSLHFNAVGRPTVEGVETFAFTPRDQPSTARTTLHTSDRRDYPANRLDVWNTLLAYEVQAALVKLPGATDRGLKRARWEVLRDLSCPGVLIEGGFVSHPREGRDIGSAAYRQRLAEAILAGVKAYEARLEAVRRAP